ncbi:MAG: hypothetical protein M5R40_27455 [Anaerolineae bacterium]|nr:hypothetical protein [Anaerolineae bacterium]
MQRFDIDPYYILQVICSQLKRSIKRSDVLDLDAHEVARVWKDAIWGMEQALRMLFEDCGVLKPDLLSYNTILVPLASTFMKNRSVTGPAVGAMRNKIKQWYWCSVFGQTYESNPTSQTMIDIEQLQRWIAGDRLPDSVSDFKFEKEALFSTTTRQRAVYRGCFAWFCANRH